LPGPAGNYISDIAIDSAENVWLTHAVSGFSSLEGISKFDGENWSSYNYQNSGLGANGAFAADYDYQNDLMWFGSWGDGLFSFDGNTSWANYDETNSPLGGLVSFPFYVPVTDVAMDDKGNIWVLEITADNPPITMAVFNPNDSTWFAYYEDPVQIPDHFQRVLDISENDVFIGGTNVYHLAAGNNATDDSDDQWSETIVNTGAGEVYALGLDFNNKLLIGGAWGLIYYDLEFDFSYNDTVTVELPDAFRTAVNTIAVDGLGYSWVGTDSGIVVLHIPLGQIQAKIIDTFKTANSGLISNSVKHIEIDGRTGKVYIATTVGLSIYESGNIASRDLKNLVVYPNPVNIPDGDEFITFSNIPAEAEVSVYNAAGDLIIRQVFSDRRWDLKNKERVRVAAGVYFFHVAYGDKSGLGKFAVIR